MLHHRLFRLELWLRDDRWQDRVLHHRLFRLELRLRDDRVVVHLALFHTRLAPFFLLAPDQLVVQCVAALVRELRHLVASEVNARRPEQHDAAATSPGRPARRLLSTCGLTDDCSVMSFCFGSPSEFRVIKM